MSGPGLGKRDRETRPPSCDPFRLTAPPYSHSPGVRGRYREVRTPVSGRTRGEQEVVGKGGGSDPGEGTGVGVRTLRTRSRTYHLCPDSVRLTVPEPCLTRHEWLLQRLHLRSFMDLLPVRSQSPRPRRGGRWGSRRPPGCRGETGYFPYLESRVPRERRENTRDSGDTLPRPRDPSHPIPRSIGWLPWFPPVEPILSPLLLPSRILLSSPLSI